MQDQLIDRYF